VSEAATHALRLRLLTTGYTPLPAHGKKNLSHGLGEPDANS